MTRIEGPHRVAEGEPPETLPTSALLQRIATYLYPVDCTWIRVDEQTLFSEESSLSLLQWKSVRSRGEGGEWEKVREVVRQL